MSDLIGQIVPAGTSRAQWLYVTRVDGEAVYGKTWIARRKAWSKTDRVYGRKALFRMTPRCERPDGYSKHRSEG